MLIIYVADSIMVSWRAFDSNLIDAVRLTPVLYNTRLKENKNIKMNKSICLRFILQHPTILSINRHHSIILCYGKYVERFPSFRCDSTTTATIQRTTRKCGTDVQNIQNERTGRCGRRGRYVTLETRLNPKSNPN